MLVEALGHTHHNDKTDRLRIFFAADSLDPRSFSDLLDIIEIPKTLFLVISKSGGTIEVMTHLAIVLDKLKDYNLCIKDQIVAITDEKKGILKSFADEHQCDQFVVPDGIGGRFSVLSDVGLVVAELLGFDSESVLKGVLIKKSE